MSWETIVKDNNLDISEIKVSSLFGSIRLDAECYQQRFLSTDSNLLKKEITTLEKIAKVTDGDHSKFPDNQTQEYRYLRSKDIKSYFLVDDDPIFISKEYFQKQKRSHISGENILISIMGNVGDITITPKNYPICIANRAVCILKDININPYYLFTYLISDIANINIERLKTGGVQERINLEILRTLRIPIPKSNEFVSSIETTVIKSQKINTSSLSTFLEAENLLLKEINLDKHKVNTEGISVRSLSECLKDNRFDTEYWQLEYDEVIRKINSYKLGASIIGIEFKQLKSNFKAEAKQEYKYVEIGDINVSTGEVDSSAILAEELPANAKILFGKRQLVTSKVRPNRGATAILDNQDGFIGSGAFVVLQEKQSINLETLMVYLKLQPIKDLLLRYNTGTSYPTIIDGDVLKLPMPLIDKKVQEKISELLITSKRQRLEAKELLEKAKRAVEIFIEKDEAEALKYLNK